MYCCSVANSLVCINYETITILIVCCALASTTVTTKKVVKQPKDVAVKKEVLTIKSKPPPPPIAAAARTQCTNSTITSAVTSASSQVKLIMPTSPVTKLIPPPPAAATKNTALPLPVTKNTTPPPPVTKTTATPPPVTKSVAPPLPEHAILSPQHTTLIPPTNKYTMTPPATKYTTLTVGSVLQARPLMTSSTNLLVSNKAMPHPVVMNIPNAQLEKMLAMTHPIMQLTTGEGSQIHSSTVTMSLPPQSIIPTTLVNQKQNENPSQWHPLPSSSIPSNLGSISTTPNVLMKTTEMITSSSNNHQVLQEHSYQRAENVKSTVSNSLPFSASDQPHPKLFISPMNSPFK